MSNRALGPVRDESLHRAAQRILRILEQEEQEKRQHGYLSPSANRFDRARDREADHRHPIVDPAQSGLFKWMNDYELMQETSAFAREVPGLQQAQAVPIPAPIPLPLPPIVIPGTKENEEWEKLVRKLLRDWSRSRAGGGPDCDQEWSDARRTCRDELAKSHPNDGITGGYSNVEDCARGLVREVCGGNKVEWIPRHWKHRRRRK
jgi:hypothetical protein